MFRVLSILLMLMLLIICFNPTNAISKNKENDPVKQLQKLFWPEGKYNYSDLYGFHPATKNNVENILVNSGIDVIPVLKKALIDTSHRERPYDAIVCLAIKGGVEARDVLKNHYYKTKNTYTKMYLCYCMATTGSKDDIKFLIKSLSEDRDIEASILSLGVLKAKESLDALKKIASENPGSYTSSIAKTAINRIKMGDKNQQCNASTIESEYDKIKLTLFNFGIPRTDESNIFDEKRLNRIWEKENNCWLAEEIKINTQSPVAPVIDFNISISGDSTKAIVNVGINFAPLNGSGYIFLLNKEQGAWTVKSIISAWLS